jgi:superfamily II DNA or RNA helicase
MGTPDNMQSSDDETFAKLAAENSRLVALLEAHGIAWRQSPVPAQVSPASAALESSNISTAEKIRLFRSLFRGREDVYPVRWVSKSSDKKGYAPACANEWKPGICEKPRIKCAECTHRQFIPLADPVFLEHLTGKQTIGVYPLLPDNTCRFLAVDFDEAEWRDDARAFVQSCRDLGVPVALEISRSGNGAHAWIFFTAAVMARDARRLGTALISHTCARTRQLDLKSYDRLFPNQDTMPKGGFGNLIALPLQKQPRERGWSVFVDDGLEPYSDQWAFLAALDRMAPEDIEPTILRAMGGAHPLDVTFIEEEDLRQPWKRSAAAGNQLVGSLPEEIVVTQADLVYFEKAGLPQPLANRLIRLAAFQNPEFYKAQALRSSVWDKPRVIGRAENFPNHIALPRGCLEPALRLLGDLGIRIDFRDERYPGNSIDVSFRGVLRTEQEAAVADVLRHDSGILCAPTGFGKTVSAAAIIARRSVNTLVLVHRTELLMQWQERLRALLQADQGIIGIFGGGKKKPSGKIDIAVIQSLFRRGEVNPLVETYGQIIVDECHHVGAQSFEAVLKTAKAKYILGLTATPIRRDGQQPIIFMQCGPVRHSAGKSDTEPSDMQVIAREVARPISLPETAGIQEVFREIAADPERSAVIIEEILAAIGQQRKVLVLTERTEHLEALNAVLVEAVPNLFVLHGRMTKKQRGHVVEELEALPPDAPRVLLATGKLVGEGFDHPPLDTLVLAMPISWKGTLQQYAGRLNRAHVSKSNVRIIDIVDSGHPALMRMWGKRQRGYKAMGYRGWSTRVCSTPGPDFSESLRWAKRPTQLLISAPNSA